VSGARRRAFVGVTVGCLVALGTTAAESARAACTRDGASDLYTDARRAFDDKRYDDSIELLRRAYACDPNPVYLHNVARAYEEANRPKDALAAWRAYLEVSKDERERVQVQGRISTLSKMIDDLDRLEHEKEAAEQARLAAEAVASSRPVRTTLPPPPPVTSVAAPSRHVAAGAWLLSGVGASGLIVAAVLGLESIAKHGAAVNEPQVVQAESLQSQARNLAQAANWMWAVGGAVTVIGAGWIGVDLVSPRPTSTTARLGLGVAGPGVLLGLSGSM
jgi:tetratricopeptide (TPR) repeat protein